MDFSLRKTYRKQITTLINEAEDLIKEETVDINEIPVLIARVKAAQERLHAVNEKIAPLIQESQQEKECEKIVGYNDNAVKIIARLEQRMYQQRQTNVVTSRNEEPMAGVQMGQSQENSAQVQGRQNHSLVRLPKLDIVKFDGNIVNWPAFWEQYKLAIHENRSLDGATKFAYLRSYLSGKALVTINGLTSSQLSYNDAIELLKVEYANTERIVNIYIQKLLAIAHVKYEKDTHGLRKLYNTASTITKSLSTLGISPNQYGLLVKSTIFKALPYNLRISFNKQKLNDIDLNGSSSIDVTEQSSTKEVDYTKQITGLLQFIKIELDAIEEARCSSDWENNQKQSNNNYTDKSKNKTFTAAGLLTSVKDGCLFCQGKTHLTKDCDSSLDINEKKNILKQKRLCFRCTKPNHNSKNCKSKDINCAKCKYRHVTAMCDPKYRERHNGADTKSSTSNSSINLLTNGQLDNVYLKTACAYIVTNDAQKEKLVRMIIDGGSQLSFIKEDLSRQLGLHITGTHKIAIQSFGKSSRAPTRLCNRVKLVLKGQYNDEFTEIEAIEIPEICFDSLETPCLNDPIIREFSECHQLADVKQKQQSVRGISLLIGADNYWKLITGETKRLTKDLTAVHSKFGWTLLGSSASNNSYDFMVNLNLVTMLNVQVVGEDFNIKDFWTLEAIGINSNEKMSNSFTEDFINEKIKFKDGRYEVSLPWKTEQLLDSNYAGALSRVNNLTKKLLRNGKLYEYDSAMREYLKNDCAEIVSNNSCGAKTYYMPHRPVYRDDKDTTKLRVVYDASAHGPSFESLNEQLATGANLVPDLVKMLLKFRIGSIGLTADIEKAFLQIVLNESDRDSHRFLWYNNPIKENIETTSELSDLITYRMKRVTFGVTTSPFLLAATMKKHFSEQPVSLKKTADILNKSFYVDDLILAVNKLEEAVSIYNQAKQILAAANMNLRKWCSNNSELNAYFKEKEECDVGSKPKKVLGILWYTATDELAVDVSHIISNTDFDSCPTKRSVLQIMARIFDPLGVLGPYTVRSKIIMQCIWKQGFEWDAQLSEDLRSEWIKWYVELPILANWQIPRMVLNNCNNEVELHVFADASTRAYGTVAYLKCLITNTCHILISKNRVAPLNKKGGQQLTLPKLELTAALCAGRLQNNILKSLTLNVKEIFMWSDSKITLYWIKRDSKKREIYITNRVNEIRSLTKGKWKYCPSKENPADLLTRGVSAKHLYESEMWLNGPSWLQEEQQRWPPDDTEDNKFEQINILVNIGEVKNDHKGKMKSLFELEKFEKLERILNITAYVLRFIQKCQKMKLFGPLQASEIKRAENYWLKYVQRNEYGNEIEALSKSKKISNRSTILTLSPFLDDKGIMRLGGRLQEACLPYETKHPVILPQKSPYTIKVITRCHERIMHSGVNASLNELRNCFWVIRGRQIVKSIISRCRKCKRMKGKKGNEPFAPLPRNRLTMANPFKITGVDFAGPLYVTNADKQVKAYIMLFTCAVVRAIHLELVPDLTTESCIRALRKFIARRGVPNVIYSDNAKTFRRTSHEIQELFHILTTENVQNLSKVLRIEWHFIVERASWWGGFWERLVKTVKDALKLTLGRARVNYDELQTILTEVEATVNSRPLTFIDDDPSNLLILSPAHFLIGSNQCGFSMDLKNAEIRRNDILQQWKNRELKLSKFWKQWGTDYLQQLRSVHYTPKVKSRTIKKGDVALLHDQQLPRLQWKLVRVVDLFQGRDGKTRACEIQTSNGTRLRRPVQLLYPLEVDNCLPGEDVENTASPDLATHVVEGSERSAAVQLVK